MSEKLPPKILVIEYDEAANTSLSNDIERYSFNVIKATSAEIAAKAAALTLPNVAIISSRIQDSSSLEVAIKLRRLPNLARLPYIFLLDNGESPRNYAAVDNGLIELVFRPFTPNQLMGSIKSLLRRSQPVFQDKVLKHKDISIDLATYKVFHNGKSIHVGPTEFKILQLLMQAPYMIHSRQQIIDYVWGIGKEIEHRTVDVHINRLRSLIKGPHNDMHFIKTVRANGYCLNLPGEVD